MVLEDHPGLSDGFRQKGETLNLKVMDQEVRGWNRRRGKGCNNWTGDYEN